MNLLKTIVIGGPVGLAHALREAWVARRVRSISTYMDRERDLHREHMAQLRAELDAMQAKQVSSTARAASFWKGLS
ncbi:hypothetical protein [Acidovorax radicis]|uniref:hypothetical protein n=1 Tax=Acidovorax radicis TaxID=758826 RepID=UPI001CF9EC22|nr:hypothetical protein [Acidovorax radicis]UCV00723.1 hypothetical protein KI609_08225 [Acidovorax radicis]